MRQCAIGVETDRELRFVLRRMQPTLVVQAQRQQRMCAAVIRVSTQGAAQGFDRAREIPVPDLRAGALDQLFDFARHQDTITCHTG
jgi:hypothetical protein